MRRWPWAILRATVLGVGYLAVMAGLTWPLAARATSALPHTSIGCFFDTLYSAWTLSYVKRLLSRWAGLSLHRLRGLPTRDPTNNFKLYRTAMLRALPLDAEGGFDVALELTVKAWRAGYRIVELPATWHDRTAGRSRFRLARWLPRYLRWYLLALLPRGRRERPA